MKEALFQKTFEVVDKQPVNHQVMMGMLKDQGYSVGSWIPVWARILKSSKITPHDLERLLKISLPPEYNKRGFIRNRLKERDWHKYF